jgi:hypothetical protein
VSEVDATNEAAGIHCGNLDEKWGRIGASAARKLLRIVTE